jgi:hypothetical protein
MNDSTRVMCPPRRAWPPAARTAAPLVLVTQRDREAGTQDPMVALAAAARSVAGSVSDRGLPAFT